MRVVNYSQDVIFFYSCDCTNIIPLPPQLCYETYVDNKITCKSSVNIKNHTQRRYLSRQKYEVNILLHTNKMPKESQKANARAKKNNDRSSNITEQSNVKDKYDNCFINRMYNVIDNCDTERYAIKYKLTAATSFSFCTHAGSGPN